MCHLDTYCQQTFGVGNAWEIILSWRDSCEYIVFLVARILYLYCDERRDMMKYGLSPREILRAKSERFPEGPGYILLYVLIQVTVQTFWITIQHWPSWEINIERVVSSSLLIQVGNTGKYCNVDWAILDSLILIL